MYVCVCVYIYIYIYIVSHFLPVEKVDDGPTAVHLPNNSVSDLLLPPGPVGAPLCLQVDVQHRRLPTKPETVWTNDRTGSHTC